MAIATELEAGIDAYMNNFVTSTSSSLCSALIPLALTGVTIYIIVMGWAVMRGEAHDSLHTATWKLFRLTLIGAIALGGGAYQANVVDLVNGLQSGLVSAMSGEPSIGAAIDNMGAPYKALKAALFQQAFSDVIPSFGILIGGVIVTIAHAWVMFVSLGFYLIAKVSLALVLAIGPVFILCAMFPATQRFTESWAGQALNYVVLNTLIAASIAMVTSLATQFAEHITTNNETLMVIEAATNLLIVSLTLGFVVKKHDQLAQALTGGLSIGNLGFNVPRPSTGATSAARATRNELSSASSQQGVTASRPVATAISNLQRLGSGTTSSQAGGLYNRHTIESIRKASTQ